MKKDPEAQVPGRISGRASSMGNADVDTVKGFGDEWDFYDQGALSAEELQRLFDGYFRIFPWEMLPRDSAGFDLGCGSGRFARIVAGRIGLLHCIDASEKALSVAKENLASLANVRFHHASVGALPLADDSMDFGYSLGVLHHVPDTQAGLVACVRKLKPGAPFLLYLYYALDGRPWWYRLLWSASDHLRRLVSRWPFTARVAVANICAAFVYWPVARLGRLLEACGCEAANFPLAFYRYSSYYSMATDALDRFGTKLEKRFSKSQIVAMMSASGLNRIRFSETMPFWVAVGFRRVD